jgi:hypothetical protein
LEAQQKADRDYLNGGAWELVAEHVEVESGKKGCSGSSVFASRSIMTVSREDWTVYRTASVSRPPVVVSHSNRVQLSQCRNRPRDRLMRLAPRMPPP